MTNVALALAGVSYTLPDGRTLFSDLNEPFDQRRTALVGRNGVGKSVLARILAGRLEPTTGRCENACRVHYLAQQVSPMPDTSVADLAGVRARLDALARIEAGSYAVKDFDTLGEQWDLRHRLVDALASARLGHLQPDTRATDISGGEAMRASLLGPVLSGADFLILDEPSNHLDRPNRLALIEQLKQWSGGLLVVSHDRALLETMERIVELSDQGLSSYGGNYSFYAEARSIQQQAALRQLEQQKLERRREQRLMQKQVERQAKRQVRGQERGQATNQAKMLLDKQKERSEQSAGALRQQHRARQTAMNEQVHKAAERVAQDTKISLHAVSTGTAPAQCVVDLRELVLPRIRGACQRISLRLHGRQRIGVVGANGCGKSTLLRVIAGQHEPLSGERVVTSDSAYLDQDLAVLASDQNVLDCLRQANPGANSADLRARLAHLGLDADRIDTPSGALSGGERLKAALACLLYAETPPKLLLLDEPNNHLDLASTQALERMLRGYPGALMVVSHDDAFLDQLALGERFHATSDGWEMRSVPEPD